MNWVEVNGVGLRYELSGAADKTVLLIHELGGSIESFDEAAVLLGERMRTLRLDLRGFGRSEKIRGPVALADLVADIVALLDHLGIEQVYAAGAAFGGGLALALAAREPSRAAGAAVSSPAVASSPQWRASLLERADAVEREGMRRHVAESLDRSYPEALRSNRARFERYRLQWLANDPQSFASCNRMLTDVSLLPELGSIRCPTLVIGCRRDAIRPPSASKAVAEAIPGARYRETDSGHFMPVQTPELFAELLIDFFGT